MRGDPFQPLSVPGSRRVEKRGVVRYLFHMEPVPPPFPDPRAPDPYPWPRPPACLPAAMLDLPPQGARVTVAGLVILR